MSFEPVSSEIYEQAEVVDYWPDDEDGYPGTSMLDGVSESRIDGLSIPLRNGDSFSFTVTINFAAGGGWHLCDGSNVPRVPTPSGADLSSVFDQQQDEIDAWNEILEQAKDRVKALSSSRRGVPGSRSR